MNDLLQDFARQTIKDLLLECTEGQQLRFKQMYSHGDLDLPINEVVDKMHETKLEWAMAQCQTTVSKNNAHKA